MDAPPPAGTVSCVRACVVVFSDPGVDLSGLEFEKRHGEEVAARLPGQLCSMAHGGVCRDCSSEGEKCNGRRDAKLEDTWGHRHQLQYVG